MFTKARRIETASFGSYEAGGMAPPFARFSEVFFAQMTAVVIMNERESSLCVCLFVRSFVRFNPPPLPPPQSYHDLIGLQLLNFIIFITRNHFSYQKLQAKTTV